MNKSEPKDWLSTARESILRKINSLEAIIKPSEKAFARRVSEIDARKKRYEQDITRAMDKARRDLLLKVAEKKEKIAELKGHLTAIEDQAKLPPLKTLRDAAYVYFTENNIERATVSEFANRIATMIRCSPGAQFNNRLYAALENDIRFAVDENNRFYLLEV